MLAHVRGTLCLGKPDEAIDVLRTGVVASSSSSSSKLDEAALRALFPPAGGKQWELPLPLSLLPLLFLAEEGELVLSPPLAT